LLALRDAVLGEQLTQLPGADSALAGLDPADLRAVAAEDPGWVFERVPEVVPVAGQRGAYQAPPYRWCGDHGSCLRSAVDGQEAERLPAVNARRRSPAG